MLAEKSTYIESAYKQLQIISQDKEKRMEYEYREKAVRDYNQLMKEAEQRGEQRGVIQGKIEIVKNLLKLNYHVDTICQITGLSKEEVQTFIKD